MNSKMKKLRLIVTTKCNKTCEGCSNKQFDIDSLPTIEPHEMHQYDEIYIMGGEPMKVSGLLSTLLDYLLYIEKYKGKVIIYTSDFADLDISNFSYDVHGFTVTLHDDEDLETFEDTMKRYNKFSQEWLKDMSLRLNVFKGVRLPKEKYLQGWTVKKDIERIDNCPLPEGEELKRLRQLL